MPRKKQAKQDEMPLSIPDRGRYFRAILMTLISDGARSMIFEPENSALARSQGPEGLCSTPANSKVS